MLGIDYLFFVLSEWMGTEADYHVCGCQDRKLKLKGCCCLVQ